MADTGKNRLHEAAIEGNVTMLLELLHQDPLLLDRVDDNSMETPLHVTALLGHVRFVEEILKRRPQLAKELDSRGRSALHLAAAKGFVEIVKLLLEVDADNDMCLLWDSDGRNPLHLAAVRGRVGALAELLRATPEAAQTVVDGGGTVLHLCVKYNQLEALKMLIESVRANNDSFVNVKDDYGFSILHLAVSNKQLRTVEYLINNTRIEVNALTSNGLTPLDILIQSHRDLKDMDISHTLTAAGATQTTATLKPPPSPPPSSSSSPHKFQTTQILSRVISALFNNKNESWILSKQEAIMVAASLIATMAFQAGVSPPGGVWQEDDPLMNRTAGTSILAEKHLETYKKFLAFNTTGFTASLIVILMLITGLPTRHLIFVRILVVVMWVAITSMARTYGVSIKFFTPKDSDTILFRISIAVSFVVSASFGLFFLGKLFYILSQRERKPNTHPNKPTTHKIPYMRFVRRLRGGESEFQP